MRCSAGSSMSHRYGTSSNSAWRRTDYPVCSSSREMSPSKICSRATWPLAAASSRWRSRVGRNSIVVTKNVHDSQIDSKWLVAPVSSKNQSHRGGASRSPGRRSTFRRIRVPSTMGSSPSWSRQEERWVNGGWTRSQAWAWAAVAVGGVEGHQRGHEPGLRSGEPQFQTVPAGVSQGLVGEGCLSCVG